MINKVTFNILFTVVFGIAFYLVSNNLVGTLICMFIPPFFIGAKNSPKFWETKNGKILTVFLYVVSIE